MKTRFDGTLWIGAGGQAFRPAEMGTDHLLNTVKMLDEEPPRRGDSYGGS